MSVIGRIFSEICRINILSKMNEAVLSLKKLFTEGSKVFEQVLLDPSLDKACKSNLSDLRKYLSRHLPRLCKTAFKDNNEEITLKALKLLTCGNQLVIPNLVKTTFFPDLAKKYLAQNEITSRQIGRICDITFSIFQSGITDIIKDCDYVLALLDHCENLGVYNLFSRIFADDEKLEPHREWLCNIGFDKKLAEMLKEMLKKNYSLNYSQEQEKLITILSLVAEAAKNSKLRKHLMNGEIGQIFKQTYILPPYLLNYFWNAVNNLYTVEYYSFFNIHINAAKTALLYPEEKVYKYQIDALNFLIKSIDINPKIVDEKLIKAILHLMITFNQSSALLCEARQFFLKCYTMKDIQDITFKNLVPLMLNQINNKNNGLISIFAMAILQDISKIDSVKKSFKKIDGVSKFIKQKLEPYNKKLANSYGGEFKESQNSPKKRASWETPYPK